jgi:putative transposase
MKKSRFTDSQIAEALKRVEAGLSVPELCRELGISSATFYKWRAKRWRKLIIWSNLPGGKFSVSLMCNLKLSGKEKLPENSAFNTRDVMLYRSTLQSQNKINKMRLL